jgi:hypothetical protein
LAAAGTIASSNRIVASSTSKASATAPRGAPEDPMGLSLLDDMPPLTSGGRVNRGYADREFI